MEDFVSFKLAQKLKEKGYPQHWSDNDYIVENEYEDNFEIGAYYDRCLIPEHIVTIAAPTISQVLKWLREEKKLHIEFVGNACGYLYIVSDIPSEGGTDRYCSDYSGPDNGGTWDKYEDCALNAIQYVLDNLI